VYTPETLPREYALPTHGGRAWHEEHRWLWVPAPPPAAADAALAASAAALSLAEAPPPPLREHVEDGPAIGPGFGVVGAAGGGGPLHGAADLVLPQPPAADDDDEAALELRRMVGFSGERPKVLLWLAEHDTFAFAAAAVLVLQRIDTGEQRHLVGHTAPICAVAAARDTPLLASAQAGPVALIRLWDRAAAVCVATIQLHASDMQCLALSADGSLLAAVGKDGRGRQSLAVWDVRGAAARLPTCTLLDARVSQYHIRALKFVPAPASEAAQAGGGGEEVQLVTCGFENVRFWRLRRGKLHACSMPLQHHEGEMFLDLAIDAATSGGGGPQGKALRRMLVSSSSGKVFQVDISSRKLEYVYQLHDAPINAVLISPGFAVTASDDHKLRVWPLDFASHVLEAEHEGPVTSVDASLDGLKLLVGTATGTIGVLDVPTQKHVTLVRSHTDIVYGLALDPHNEEYATASCDGTVRIWAMGDRT